MGFNPLPIKELMAKKEENAMTIEERLENMERELGRVKRRNHWLLGAILLLVGGLVAVGALKAIVAPAQAQGAGTAEEIRAKKIVLEDDNGKVRAWLDVVAGIPMMMVLDENGEVRVALAAGKDDPRLVLCDEKGRGRTRLGTGKDGPNLALYDENGKVRAALSADKDGPNLVLYDENGKVIWSAIK